MKSPEWGEKWAAGPAGFTYVFPAGKYNMGAAMGLSLLFNVVGAAAVAWLTSKTLYAGAETMSVFKYSAVCAFLIFGAAHTWGPIWMAMSWKVWVKDMIDAAVYGAAVGGVFAGLWPAAPA